MDATAGPGHAHKPVLRRTSRHQSRDGARADPSRRLARPDRARRLRPAASDASRPGLVAQEPRAANGATGDPLRARPARPRDRCGERMYCLTSPYKRKDGSQQRFYICANVRNETGLCDQPKLDAAKIDAAVVAHLDRLFIDFEAWLAQLAKGAADHRAGLEAELGAQLDRLAELERLEAKLRRRYVEVVETNDPNRPAVETTLNEVLADKAAHQQRASELQQTLAAEPQEPPTDAMLDVYNAIASAVRGGDSQGGVAELNERLRAVFEEFRLDRVDADVVGVLPVLRPDVIERYRASDSAPVMADYEDAIPTTNLPDSSPTVLWATEPPPAKPLAVPSETGPNTQIPGLPGARLEPQSVALSDFFEPPPLPPEPQR
ncbi:MAG: zinc ribbon domain-containing protein [Thermoleophilaceae bacterium]